MFQDRCAVQLDHENQRLLATPTTEYPGPNRRAAGIKTAPSLQTLGETLRRFWTGMGGSGQGDTFARRSAGRRSLRPTSPDLQEALLAPSRPASPVSACRQPEPPARASGLDRATDDSPQGIAQRAQRAMRLGQFREAIPLYKLLLPHDRVVALTGLTQACICLHDYAQATDRLAQLQAAEYAKTGATGGGSTLLATMLWAGQNEAQQEKLAAASGPTSAPQSEQFETAWQVRVGYSDLRQNDYDVW